MSWEWQPLTPSAPLLLTPTVVTYVPPVFPHAVPRKRGLRADQQKAHFWVHAPAAAAVVPPLAWKSTYPDRIDRKHNAGYRHLHFTRQIFQPLVPPLSQRPPVFPSWMARHDQRARYFQSWFGPRATIADAVVPPVGGTGDVLAMDVQSGSKVTFSWLTDVLKSWSGKEQRIAINSMPRQRYEFSSLLTDGQTREVFSLLAGAANDGVLFLLGLAYEALTIVSSTSSTIAVQSTTFADWAVPGQRIMVVSRDGLTNGTATIQSAGGGVININADLTAIALPGARVMPAQGVYLEPDQSLGRYRVNAGTIDLAARAARHKFGLSSNFGIGATVNTFDVDGDGVAIPLWDFGIDTDGGVTAHPIYSGTELVDLGGLVTARANYTQSDWGRGIRIASGRTVDWQWLKALLANIRGRQRTFLLPTGRSDLIPVGDASSGTLTVQGPPTAGAPDYANDYFPSLAHRRIKLFKTDGTIAYRKVTSAAGGAGTQDLVLNSALSGALARVEFLELVRLESDDVTVTWQGHVFSCALSARVVQQ